MPYTINDIYGKHLVTIEDADNQRNAVILATQRGISLAGANLTRADLTGADLTRANLADANLADANLADANLTGAYLARANLTGADLTGANLADANLADANLTGAYLARAYLARANLTGADLARANLTGAGLTGAGLQKLAPLIRVPSLHRQILAAIEAGGSLDMSDWHKCETTHCRAGWAIQLAGPAGKVLEACLGPSAAGALIHVVSCPQLEGKVPNFTAGNKEAMEDIKRLAALEPELESAAKQSGKNTRDDPCRGIGVPKENPRAGAVACLKPARSGSF